VEVVDAPNEYNFLLRCTCFYEMTTFVSLIFRVLRFPHQGKIVTIDQLAFFTPFLGSNVGSNVPFFGGTQQCSLSVGVGMFKYTSLMGIFPLPPPPPIVNIVPINMISSFSSGSLGFVYHWVVPHFEIVESYGAPMLLIAIEIGHLKIPSTFVDTGDPGDQNMIKNQSAHNCLKTDLCVGLILIIPTKLEWVQTDVVCERYHVLSISSNMPNFVHCTVYTV
jgi:hypothetical protein